MNHEKHMQHAIALGKKNPKHPYGAIIVDSDNKVIATGYNQSSKGAIYHGEIVALEALFASGGKDERDLTIYSTAEPCPMCSSALLWSGIAQIVFGTSIDTLKSQGRPQIDIYCKDVAAKFAASKVAVIGGVCEAECDELFAHNADKL